MRPPSNRGSARTRLTLAPRMTRADATKQRITDLADAKRAYPTTPAGQLLKKQSPDRFREPRHASKMGAAKTGVGVKKKGIARIDTTETTSSALRSLIGHRVRIFWHSENTFFKGKITQFDLKTGKHHVTYDDGDFEKVKLHWERFSWDGKSPSVAAKIVLAALATKDPAPVANALKSSKALNPKPEAVALKTKTKTKSDAKTVSTKTKGKVVKTKGSKSSGKQMGELRASSGKTSKTTPEKATKTPNSETAVPMDVGEVYDPVNPPPVVDSVNRPEQTADLTSVPASSQNPKLSIPKTGIVPGSKIAIVLEVAVPLLRTSGKRGLPSQDIMDALLAAGKGFALAGRKAPKIGVLAALDRGTAVGLLRKLPVNGRTKRYQLAEFEPLPEDVLPPQAEKSPKPPKATKIIAEMAERKEPKPAAPAYRVPSAKQCDVMAAGVVEATPPPQPSSITVQPHMRMSEDEAWAVHSPSPWEPMSPEAVRDAWVCCESPTCGKWRRVPAVVAARVELASVDPGWRCADGRDNRFSTCELPQEFPSDDIDTRVALTNKAEAKRERKRRLDREYRVRRKARIERERRVELGLDDDEGFIDDDDDQHPVAVLLIVIGNGDFQKVSDSAYVMLSIAYPPPKPPNRQQRYRPPGMVSPLTKKNKKSPKTSGFATLQSLWAKAPTPRLRTVPYGLLYAMRKHCVFTVNGKVAVSGGGPVAVGAAHLVTRTDVLEISGRFKQLDISNNFDCERLRTASPDLSSIHPSRTHHLSTPAIVAQTEVPPGFALVPVPPGEGSPIADDDTQTLLALETMTHPEGEDMTFGDIQGEMDPGDGENELDTDTTHTIDSVMRAGWGTFGPRVSRVRSDRLRLRYKELALANMEAWRALPSSGAREEARVSVFNSHVPSFLPDVPTVGSVPFWRVPQWTHPLWPMGGAGEVGPPRKKTRKLPRVWRGKDLDMIVFGRDERLEWARKTGMFLARARTALGDRRLHRNAWGGSVLDSVLGAMLTQNVSDVLSSSAIMNLAARFPGEGACVSERATELSREADVDKVVAGVLEARVQSKTSAETRTVVHDMISQLVGSAVDAAEGVAALREVAEMADITQALPRNVEDDVYAIFDEAFGSPPGTPGASRTPTEATQNLPQPQLVSAASGAAAMIREGAAVPGTPQVLAPVALLPETPMTTEMDTSLHATPPSPPPPPSLPPKKKKTKDQIVRDERMALAVKALLVPDPYPRPKQTHDLINWRAVINAPQEEIVECIKCRGMHYMLAARIQRVLRRVERERNGELSLEFLRNVPTDEVRGYLLSMEGYGVKTVSCILLLALYRADFPVDVNVGRIMARLGWVPLETEESLEELSQYAPEPAVYTFLRERLNSFGLQTLFELHYHMITLGKVFCEKRTPNCGACPLQDMCEYASSGGKHLERENGEPSVVPTMARAAAVPVETVGGTLKTGVPSGAATCTTMTGTAPPETAPSIDSVLAAGTTWVENGRPPVGAPAVLLLDPGAGWVEARVAHFKLSRLVHPDKCPHPRAAHAFELITAARNVLVPSVPDDDNSEIVRDDVVRVDEHGEVVVGARTGVNDGSNSKDFGDIEDIAGFEKTHETRPSKGFARAAKEAAASHAASPLQLRVRPSQMNTNRVRHELTAFSLPHDMVPESLKERAPGVDFDCYLAVECTSESAKLLAKKASENAGTPVTALSVLVPCRAAMYAKFPLHRTYFQTNEVFLDASTAVTPSMVSTKRLEFLPTVNVFLGSSVASICRGMSRPEVAAAFANRAVCVRSWDTSEGGRPRPLPKWACPFVPKANTLGPAPGEESVFVFQTTRDGHDQVAQWWNKGVHISGNVGNEVLDDVGVTAPLGTHPSVTVPAIPAVSAPINVESEDSEDEDDMDERWDEFLGTANRVEMELTKGDETNGGVTQEETELAVPNDEVPVRDEQVGNTQHQLVEEKMDGSLPVVGEKRKEQEPQSSIHTSPWNSKILMAFAAQRRDKAAEERAARKAEKKADKARRKSVSDASTSSGASGSREDSGKRKRNEESIMRFFRPAA